MFNYGHDVFSSWIANWIVAQHFAPRLKIPYYLRLEILQSQHPLVTNYPY